MTAWINDMVSRQGQLIALGIAGLFLCTTASPALQRDTTQAVVFKGDTIAVFVSRLGTLTPEQRAHEAVERLSRLVGRADVSLESLRILRGTERTDIVIDTLVILSLTDSDAATLGRSRDSLAEESAAKIHRMLEAHRPASLWNTVLTRVGKGFLALAIAGALFWILARVFPRLYGWISQWEGTVIRSINIRGREIVRASGLIALLLTVARLLRLVLSLFIVYHLLVFLFSLIPWTQDVDLQPLLTGILLSILATVVALALLKANKALHRWIVSTLKHWQGTLIQGIRIQSVEILSAERITQLFLGLAMALRYALMIGIAYAYLTAVFGFFEVTRTWASTLLAYITDPLSAVVVGIVNFFPKLIFIAIIVVVTRLIIKFVRLIFVEVERGTVTFSGFHPEWAMPTYKIARFLIIAFAAVMIFPYLPGSDSDAFKGISVFLGILFSLGSAGAISNMIAGLVITYMRPFRLGDRVKIGDATGDVVEKTLLATRIRTTKNVDISIPNAMVQMYSTLHQNIQDSFFEAGVEILSPHYFARRDGSKPAIPDEFQKPQSSERTAS